MTSRPIVHLVAGARPNFMKIAPVWHALSKVDWCAPQIVHTGQHSDINMSEWFFRDLQLPPPHHHLAAKTGSHATTTGTTMIAYEALCQKERPAWSVVVGDVDSTIACAMTAKKLGISVAHLEAGLRSNDWAMPEEINRVLTDRIADLLWTPSPDGDENLAKEGVPRDRIELIGNVMIDSLVMAKPLIGAVDLDAVVGQPLPKQFAVVTLHRPSNVDTKERLADVVALLRQLAQRLPVIFPVHPRTRLRLESFGLLGELADNRIIQLKPLGYIEFVALVHKARLILTDSGGVQEETTYLGVPCLTLRENTERPVTVTHGTNRLTRLEAAIADVDAVLKVPVGAPPVIPLWDGRAAERVAQSLRKRIVGR
jgi:UDP-N-acetylglucosamine 2-epimerase (non-hydrolysing)